MAGKDGLTPRARTRRGMVCVLVGAVCWGFSGSCAQALMGPYGIDPLWIGCWRMLVAGLLFVAYSLIADRANFLAMMRDRASVGLIVLFAFLGIGFTQMSYLFAIQNSNAGTATLLQELGVALVMLVACVRTRSLPGKRQLVGLVLAFLGTFVISTQGDVHSLAISPLGLFWGLMSAVALVGYTLIPVRLLSRWGAIQAMGVSTLLVGIAMTAVIRPWTMGVTVNVEVLALLAGLVVVGTLVAYTMYLQGVKDAGPVLASLLGTVEPVSAMVVSAVWLGTAVTRFDALGCVLILGMVFMLSLPSSKKRKRAKAGAGAAEVAGVAEGAPSKGGASAASGDAPAAFGDATAVSGDAVAAADGTFAPVDAVSAVGEAASGTAGR